MPAQHSNNAGRRGFTMVELLTVVAIVALLIAILVPSVNAVRTHARVAASEAAISAISTGLETFRADGQVGGAYPPSASDKLNNSQKLMYKVDNPYATSDGTLIEVSGAGLLVWALAGADLLGTPGFHTTRSSSTYWGDDTDAVADGGNTPAGSGAYAINTNTQEPIQSRVAPYVDLSKIRVMTRQKGSNPGEFILETEEQAVGRGGGSAPSRTYPMFLDAFGYPILYYKADPAGLKIADRSPTDGTAAGLNRGVYHFLDNGALLTENLGGGPGTNQPVLQLRSDSGSTPHLLTWVMTLGGGAETTNFGKYIQNKDVTAKPTPHNRDTFLLISPGPDGLYGSGDDITNFPNNGGELK